MHSKMLATEEDAQRAPRDGGACVCQIPAGLPQPVHMANVAQLIAMPVAQVTRSCSHFTACRGMLSLGATRST